MILSILTVSCCKLCCKIEKISSKMAMSLKNSLFRWRNLRVESFVNVKMTELCSFLTIWSDYLSILSLSIFICIYVAISSLLFFPCARDGLRPPSLPFFFFPSSSSSTTTTTTTTTTTDMAPWSIASTCSSAMTHSFSESSNVLAQSTLTLTLTHTSTYIHSHTASLHEGEGEILTQLLLLFLARLFN